MIPSPQKEVLFSHCINVICDYNIIESSLEPSNNELYNGYINKYVNQLAREFGLNRSITHVDLIIDHCDNEIMNDEGYHLIIESDYIQIKGKTSVSVGHAFQSLLQLIYIAAKDFNGLLKCRKIEDYPYFKYRGLHLDVSRHFFDKEFIMEFLNWMEALKLNKLHWHLSDDQGWRIESKRYPKLTEIGAWRKEPDGSKYGGYYSQEQIKEIVAYASSMGIEIIPEIDIPGHAMAILASYPDFACEPKEFETLTCWGISEDILCAGNDEVIEFLDNIFTEIADLFPGRLIHIGGDEAPKTKWEKCSKCKNRIMKQGLRNEEELQGWIIKKLTHILASKGKTVVGWDEILDGNIDTEPIVMIWRGDGRDAIQNAITNGNRMILSPNHYFYFDWKQSSDEQEQGAHGVSTLENVYSYYPSVLCDKTIGLQANVWTEHMYTSTDIRYMVFPRVFALAELAWKGFENKNFHRLRNSIESIKGYL